MDIIKELKEKIQELEDEIQRLEIAKEYLQGDPQKIRSKLKTKRLELASLECQLKNEED